MSESQGKIPRMLGNFMVWLDARFHDRLARQAGLHRHA